MYSRDPSSGRPGGSGWHLVARRVPGPTYTQPHLGPALVYAFIVRAENSHGLSLPSPLSTPTLLTSSLAQGPGQQLKEAQASLAAGHVVELTTILPTSSTSIKLGWEVMGNALLSTIILQSGKKATYTSPGTFLFLRCLRYIFDDY